MVHGMAWMAASGGVPFLAFISFRGGYEDDVLRDWEGGIVCLGGGREGRPCQRLPSRALVFLLVRSSVGRPSALA